MTKGARQKKRRGEGVMGIAVNLRLSLVEDEDNKSFPSFKRRGGRNTLIVNISEVNSAAGVVDLYIR